MTQVRLQRALLAASMILGSTLAAGPGAAVIAPSLSARQTVCAGQGVPGWILVDDSWNPTACGNPTSISYNVWTLERFDDKPVGAQMRACFGPVPPGWRIEKAAWDPTACGYPTSISDNVMTIKRVN